MKYVPNREKIISVRELMVQYDCLSTTLPQLRVSFIYITQLLPVTTEVDIDIDIEDLFTVEYYKPFNISSVALFLRQTYVKQQIITEHAT